MASSSFRQEMTALSPRAVVAFGNAVFAPADQSHIYEASSKALDKRSTEYILLLMPQSPIVPFRANEKDQERLDFLKEKLGLGRSRIIRLAIERLYLSVKWVKKE